MKLRAILPLTVAMCLGLPVCSAAADRDANSVFSHLIEQTREIDRDGQGNHWRQAQRHSRELLEAWAHVRGDLRGLATGKDEHNLDQSMKWLLGAVHEQQKHQLRESANYVEGAIHQMMVDHLQVK